MMLVLLAALLNVFWIIDKLVINANFALLDRYFGGRCSSIDLWKVTVYTAIQAACLEGSGLFGVLQLSGQVQLWRIDRDGLVLLV